MARSLPPRYTKLLRDIRTFRGRLIMMTLAIAVGIFGVGTMLVAYTILTGNISRNYLDTTPASAYIEVEHLSDSALPAILQQPGVGEAELTSWLDSRIEVQPGQWMPLLLYVAPDFHRMKLNTFTPEKGAWPPDEGSILLERTALDWLQTSIGDDHTIQAENGEKLSITISGTVHDPAVAPAWQEQTAYGYITPAMMEKLTGEGTYHILKILAKNRPYDKETISQTVTDLTHWLQQEGYHTGEIRIPPPGKHPHQSQMTAIIIMLLLFSFMALLLSAILTATMIGGMLAGQVRQIGIMKAIGAGTRQIAALYLLMVSGIGTLAFVLGAPAGIAAGRGFAGEVAKLLNFTLYSQAVPLRVYLTLFTSAILVPLLSALPPILRASRITVREALNDTGTGRGAFGSRRLDLLLGRIRGIDRTWLLAMRNTFRRRGRLALTLLLLTAAGAMFMTSLNVKAGWKRIISDSAANRQYDMEIRFVGYVPEEEALSLIRSHEGVKLAESWSLSPAAVRRGDGLNIVRTYPDGGHGSFHLRAVPQGYEAVRFPLMDGVLPHQSDISQGVVINHNAHALFPEVEVGDPLDLTIGEAHVRLTVTGIVRENMTPSAAYVSPEVYAAVLEKEAEGRTNTVRIRLKQMDEESRKAAYEAIERSLENRELHIKTIITEEMLADAVGGHIYILIFALLFMSVLMASVGGLGLLSTMGTNVTERTREFGIMRTIGGRSTTVLRNVISEGMLIGLLSWIIGAVGAIPISLYVGDLIGGLAFRSPLPLTISPMAAALWLALIIAGAVLASAYPAWRASRLTIRDTLDHI